MRITPLDVRKQEFRRSVRGFDCDEVRAFMATMADEYEIVLVDNKQIREKVILQEEKITEYKAMERTLRDTLMTAEKLMKETRVNANKEGELIVQDAELRAKQILQECRVRTEDLRREIESLRKEKENYLGRFKSLAESQIQFIESHRTDFKDLDDRLTGIVDSVATGMAVSAEQAEKEAVVDNIVDAMIQPEPSTPSEIAEPAMGAATVPGPEVDIWRNYNPAKSTQDRAETAPNEGNSAPAQEWQPEGAGQGGDENHDQQDHHQEQNQDQQNHDQQNHDQQNNDQQSHDQQNNDQQNNNNQNNEDWDGQNQEPWKGETNPEHHDSNHEDVATETQNI